MFKVDDTVVCVKAHYAPHTGSIAHVGYVAKITDINSNTAYIRLRFPDGQVWWTESNNWKRHLNSLEERFNTSADAS